MRLELPIAAVAAAAVFALGWVLGWWEALLAGLRPVMGDSLDEVLAGLALTGLVLAFAMARSARRAARERSALDRAERQFRQAVEQVPAVIYTWDPTAPAGAASPLYLSPQLERMLGYHPDEWIDDPRSWLRVIHPDDRARIKAASDASDRAAAPFREEYRVIAGDGRVVWIRDESEVVQWDADGRATLVQGVMFDITAQKDAEHSQREAEARYRELIHNLPVVAYVASAVPGQEHRFAYVSPGVEQVTGYAADRWLSERGLWESVIHPSDRDRVTAHSLDADRSGGPFDTEYRLVCGDGRTIWVHDTSVLVESSEDGELTWQGLFQDVTERREAEEQLREAEERYRALVEQLPVAVYTDAVDDLSSAIYISPQYETLTGYSAAERLDDPELWTKMLHPEDRERVLAESLRTNETGQDFDIEYRLVRADGRTVWVHDHAVLVEGQGGSSVWQGVLTDITERRLVEEALGRRDAILEAAGFAAEQFLRAATWRDGIDDVLVRLGRAGSATRAFLFENTEVDGALHARLGHAWLRDDAPPGLNRAPADPEPYGDDFARWVEVMGAGDPIVGRLEDLPARERPPLADAGIRSVLCVPVRVDGSWWGYIGLDECREARAWQPAEVEAFRVAANTLGAAIEREREAALLAQTRERYRTLVEQIPAITYVEDASDGSAIYTSPQVASVLGFREHEWGSHAQWRAALHPDDRDRVTEEDRRTNETGEPFRAEYRLIAKSGRAVWVRDHALLIRDEQGNPLYWQGVRFDITPEKQAEAHLREAEARYRSLIETIPAVTYMDTVDGSDRTLYVSPQVEAIFGYTVEEWVRSPEVWADNVHPDDLPGVRPQIEAHNTRGATYDCEYRFRHGTTGEWRWVRDQAVILRDHDASPLFSQGVMFDITAQKLAEGRVREAEERYRGIVEHVPAAIYVDRADGSMRTIYVSPQIETMTGISPERWTADPETRFRVMADSDEAASIRASYLEAVRQGVPWHGEYRIRGAGGRTMWVHDETSFLHDEDGTAHLVQGVIFDITERKLAEQALRESEQRERDAAERLRVLDEMKNTFLAAVSHELRSPLTSILGLSLTLERSDTMDGSDRRDLLVRLAANARKLDRLLKDLLDIDRLNRGIVEPQLRTTDVGALARGAVEALDGLADRSIEIEVQSVVLPVDPAKVERVVENLVTNAVRHTEPDRRIWLRVEPWDGGVLVAVDDDGLGIPTELREAIFEPFRQGPTASAHSPGTGIGLSLVGRFAELHGGRAWVEERDGGGSSFRVFLPGPESSTPRVRTTPLEDEDRISRSA